MYICSSRNIKQFFRMTNELSIFNDERFGDIRTVINNEEQEVMFCLADVCKALDLEQVSRVRSRLKEDGVTLIKTTDRLGREQEVTFINEQNLYKVIMRSDKPQAEPFQDWVCGEVLLSIRKHSFYALEADRKALMDSKDKKIKALEKNAAFGKLVSTTKTTFDVDILAKYLKQHKVNMGRNKLYEWLRDNGWLFKKKECFNKPKQSGFNRGYFQLQTVVVGKKRKDIIKLTTSGARYFGKKIIDQLTPKVLRKVGEYNGVEIVSEPTSQMMFNF